MKHRQVIRIAAALLAASTLMAGCGGGGGDSQTITIGFVGPLTGPNAEVGQDTFNAIQLAVDQANEAGNLGGTLELVSGDDASDATTGVSAFQKITGEDGATAVLGPFNSNVAAAVATQADRAEIPLLPAGATADALVEQGYESLFRSNNGNREQAEILTQWAIEEMDWQRIAFVYQETDYGNGLLEATSDIMDSTDGKIVDAISYPPQETDFLSVATRLASADVDGVLTGSLVSELAPLLRAANQAGMSGDLFAGYADSTQLADLTGDAADGAYNASPFDPASKEIPEVSEFHSAYEDEYGSTPTIYAAQGYNAATVLIESISNVGSGDSSALIDELGSSEFSADTILGTVTFDERHQAHLPMYIQQIVDGEPTTVDFAE